MKGFVVFEQRQHSSEDRISFFTGEDRAWNNFDFLLVETWLHIEGSICMKYEL